MWLEITSAEASVSKVIAVSVIPERSHGLRLLDPNSTTKIIPAALDSAAQEGGMSFAQEMMIHNGKAVRTTRPLGNRNVFRALCLNSDNKLALYESQGVMSFGNFIDALLSQGVKEALYTDMGQGWNYCFYRANQSDKSPQYLHSTSLLYASNFVVLQVK